MLKRLLLILFLSALAMFPVRSNADDTAQLLPPTLSLFPLMAQESLPGAAPRLVPIDNNHPLSGAHPGLTRVIIGIHDSSRNALGTMSLLSTLAGPANDKILILAPQFMVSGDSARFYPNVPTILSKNFILWSLRAGDTNNYWEEGDESLAEAPQVGVSSFTALDLILVYLGQRELFPDLKDIVIVGHGSGADFVQRYAAMGTAIDPLEKEGITIRFLVANASSYLYLTPARPRPDAIGFATPATNCLQYDDYKYGLTNLNRYGKQTGAYAIKTKYGDRRITYLMGELAGMADPFPDGSCPALLEGSNRVVRGMLYEIYVSELFSDTLKGKQKALVIPKASYDPVAMLNTPCGLSVLFGDGSDCTVPAASK